MSADTEVPQLVDHFFRNEYGKAVSHLTNKFGSMHLDLAEDAVQEALIRAMQTWSFGNIPENPTGWIIRVSHNKLIDHLRRSDKIDYAENLPEYKASEEANLEEGEFNDDIIKMMFACANHQLSIEYQIILILKILCGLSVKEISSALLKKEETTAKSYTRAKKKFKQENLALVLPNKREIKDRLEVVLKAIYLLFNEGYKRTEGDDLISKDLCLEAMRLNDILLQNQLTNTASSRSIMALMCFQVARFESRTKSDGSLIPFPEQDRSMWNKHMIRLGNQYLSSIAKADIYNEYFLQAAISGFHCNADSYENTPWKSILQMYDLLYEISPNPMIALNRVVPIHQVNGPLEAMKVLESLKNERQVNDHYLFYAIKADLETALGKYSDAKVSLHAAVEKTKNQNEKDYLLQKLHNL